MGFRCGIVGLPNAGKSTLFNALAGSAAAATAAYPFSTIEPNLARVPVPDDRLEAVARVAHSRRIVPAHLDIVDIAGLVRGASRGEGLGNRFLTHIREVDALIHVLRCFEDAEVSHATGPVDPVGDAEIVEAELLLADLERLERRIADYTKKARGGDGEARTALVVAERALEEIGAGRPARGIAVPASEEKAYAELQLLTAKPVLYVCNIGEGDLPGNELSRHGEAWAREAGSPALVISAAVEAEVARLDEKAERIAYLQAIGLAAAGLDRIIRAGYALLDYITFFTANDKEARAWPLPRGASARDAAGRVHSDFARAFIRAETISFDDFLACGGETGAREAGKMRSEGRDYEVADGDLLLFRANP